MKMLKSAWAGLNGKKLIISALYWETVLPALFILYPQGVPQNINKWSIICGLFLTAIGLGHKGAKKWVESQKAE